jgi:hypothetical protein
MLKVLLKIPETLRIYHLVPIGYAQGPVAAPPRRALDEIFHYETYDMSKFAATSRWRDSSRRARCKAPIEERAERRGTNKIDRAGDTHAACAGDPAKYWGSDKPTDLVFRNGMGCHVSRRFISAIAEQ